MEVTEAEVALILAYHCTNVLESVALSNKIITYPVHGPGEKS
jgi:hypothetical protein